MSHPPPPPPPPRLPSYIPRGGAKAPVTRQEAPPPPGSFGIGIELELLLESRTIPSTADNTFLRFARYCAASYYNSVPDQFPRMYSLVQAQWVGALIPSMSCIMIQRMKLSESLICYLQPRE